MAQQWDSRCVLGEKKKKKMTQCVSDPSLPRPGQTCLLQNAANKSRNIATACVPPEYVV